MQTSVTAYHADVVQLPTCFEELVQGTAFFPGGSGFWRGTEPGGSLPAYVPEDSLMIVGHNFDGVRAFHRSRARRGEAGALFWRTLLAILNYAAVPPEGCFFTNALMGLQSSSSTGPMPSTPAYLQQCNLFLAQQIAIICPRAVVSLGKVAAIRLQTVAPFTPILALPHPSALTYISGANRQEWINEQGRVLTLFLESLSQ